jgi:hypothetical protein
MAGILNAFAAGSMTATFADKQWDGLKIPAGENCRIFGGEGSTPAIKLAGIPAGANKIQVEFNDLSYAPLSFDGGHGIIAYRHNGATTATLKSVPGYTAELPNGVELVLASRAKGDGASQGYLPPCSGGKGNTYSATIKAMKDSQVLDSVTLKLGVY